MKKLFLLSLGIAIGISAGSAVAQNCAQPPKCASLGFTKTAAECGKAATLKCPFDANAVFCVSCQSLGYNKTKNECIKEKRLMKACPFDSAFVSCDECNSNVSGEDKNKFCIVSHEGINMVYSGTYAYSKEALGCLPCEYEFTCAAGLVFNPSCNCCDWP